MNDKMLHPPGTEALQARLGLQLAGLLNQRADALPHELGERLRFARERAVARAARRPTLAAAAAPWRWRPALAAAGATSLAWWQRGAALLPLAALVAGLVLIDRWTQHEQMLVAADIDARLLVDKLPPQAYGDPGFAEFLRTPPE